MVAARPPGHTGLIERLYDRLGAHPGIGAPRPALGRNIRIGIVSPYIVIYRHTDADDTVTVLRVVHGRRRITGALLSGKCLGRLCAWKSIHVAERPFYFDLPLKRRMNVLVRHESVNCISRQTVFQPCCFIFVCGYMADEQSEFSYLLPISRRRCQDSTCDWRL